jgi:Zn-finger nucleic acid-binding protein
MHCPNRCETPLVMSERHDVEIDYCPTCRGVWLDRGELDKVLDRAGSVAMAPASGPAEDTGRWSDQRPAFGRSPDGPHRKKRKKDRFEFLQDLFAES